MSPFLQAARASGRLGAGLKTPTSICIKAVECVAVITRPIQTTKQPQILPSALPSPMVNARPHVGWAVSWDLSIPEHPPHPLVSQRAP